jgi:hypothetical protein
VVVVTILGDKYLLQHYNYYEFPFYNDYEFPFYKCALPTSFPASS